MEKNDYKVISCPSCGQRLRVPNPIPSGDCKCPNCKNVFSLSKDNTNSPKNNSQSVDETFDCNQGDTSVFIKEVAKYFMDFLETNFHKRRTPKRSIKFKNKDNLLVGLNLKKYPKFNQSIWKSINKAFDNDIDLKKGQYTANIPFNLLSFIKNQVQNLSIENINETISLISEAIEENSQKHHDDYDNTLMLCLSDSELVVKQKLVMPFIQNIEASLDRLGLGDENSIFLMEEELASVLLELLGNKISAILNNILIGERQNIAEELESVFNIEDIKTNITKFFENFEVTDMFAEAYELDRNQSIIDKQDFYLYFCDVTFGGNKYPIFYIPINLIKLEDMFSIEFDSQVFINKKALDYIAQEYNKESGKKGTIANSKGRIIYLSQVENDEFKFILSDLLNEISNFFGLDSHIDINNHNIQVAKSLLVTMTNSCHLCLFDKSDEALINDYEQILELLTSTDNPLSEAFNKVIRDFIYDNPIPFNQIIEDGWDESSVNEKLVTASPIPLNGEQRQIISSIEKKDCNYITVEGPPGTGKSHSITAIVFNSILKKQSVLVLSDKKEALDVVEDKITDVMNTVRFDKNFQNPILRLGKTGSTYSQILSKSSIDNIKTHHRAVKQNYKDIEGDIQKTVNTLKEDIDAEILANHEINMREIGECCDLEIWHEKQTLPLDIHEILSQEEGSVEIEEIRNIALKLNKDIVTDQNSYLLDLLSLPNSTLDDISNYMTFSDFLTKILNDTEGFRSKFSKELKLFDAFPKLSDKYLNPLDEIVKKYEETKHNIFGYLFRNKELKEIDKEFRAHFPFLSFEKPHKEIRYLKQILNILHFIVSKRDEGITNATSEYLNHIDYLKVIYQFLFDEKINVISQKIISCKKDIDYMQICAKKYPSTFEKLGIKISSLSSICNNSLIQIEQSKFEKLIRYITLQQKLTKDFGDIPTSSYLNRHKNIEELTTLQMTHFLDESLISFYENNRADAQAIRNVIRQKRKFDRKDFLKLKEAFPCILAGIRDYAEFIPMEPELFDLVIIDEASQVSIAQAFPALLRAKKVIIFGDRKQFSNVKAAHAGLDVNRGYINKLKKTFQKHISTDANKVMRLEKFNIKTSILEFFEFICNYNARLLKHFRGYKELISYSNKYFYQDSFHTMKIRAKPIDEVLKFSFIEHDGKAEIIGNSNTLEAEFIIEELKRMKEEGDIQSVGIITPHTNQQKRIMEMISKLPEKEFFFDELKLKIMTFDTCQGEERDIIFYSMVATKESDRLWGVFIKDLSSVDLEEDGKIKAQRLNVGFSRSKECMHFVLSKTLDEYTGSIGEALRFYENTLIDAKKEKDVSEVDSRSKMEPLILNYFYQTSFWKENKTTIDFIPQFPIGKYLKQLDRNYNHPGYVVDFYVVYTDEENQTYKIIIEYDGFIEHFEQIGGINKFNYDQYLSKEDTYRQKVLEGYGYEFLRINKFNLGSDPVATLDSRISEVVKKKHFQMGSLTM